MRDLFKFHDIIPSIYPNKSVFQLLCSKTLVWHFQGSSRVREAASEEGGGNGQAAEVQNSRFKGRPARVYGEHILKILNRRF